MFLGVVLFCMTGEATSCDMLVNTEKLYLTEEGCFTQAEIQALTLLAQLNPNRVSYYCLPFTAAGKPV